MKTKVILALVGFMLFVTALYCVNRKLITSDTGKSKKKRKKNKNTDWLEKRRQARWNEQHKSSDETELSRLTTGYLQTMLLLVLCIILVLFGMPNI